MMAYSSDLVSCRLEISPVSCRISLMSRKTATAPTTFPCWSRSGIRLVMMMVFPRFWIWSRGAALQHQVQAGIGDNLLHRHPQRLAGGNADEPFRALVEYRYPAFGVHRQNTLPDGVQYCLNYFGMYIAFHPPGGPARLNFHKVHRTRIGLPVTAPPRTVDGRSGS